MNETVSVAEATSDEAVVPERVQEALGELDGAAKEGLLALSVGVGLRVLSDGGRGGRRGRRPEGAVERRSDRCPAGHEDTDPTLKLAVYQQVLNIGKGAVELLEQTLGCTLAEARAIYYGEARAAEVDEKA